MYMFLAGVDGSHLKMIPTKCRGRLVCQSLPMLPNRLLITGTFILSYSKRMLPQFYTQLFSGRTEVMENMWMEVPAGTTSREKFTRLSAPIALEAGLFLQQAGSLPQWA